MKHGNKVNALVLYAPRVMSFEHNYDEMLGFLYARHWYSHVPGTCGNLKMTLTDLSRVERISLDAALILVADFHRNVSRLETKPFINDSNWHPSVRAVLEMMGFYELVEASGHTAEASNGITSILKFVRFVSASNVNGEKADELIEELKRAAGRTPKRVAIYGAVVEAMKNVCNHAYPPDAPARVAPCIPNWWAAGAYNPERDELQFAVFDQGVGIPATLPKMSFFESVLRNYPPPCGGS